jgi:hypothetical protein
MGINSIGNTNDPYNIHRNQQQHLGSSQPSHSSDFFGIQGQSCYVDMGKFYGVNIWNCMKWDKTPGYISEDMLVNGYVGDFFNHLKSEGVKKIDLSFAQLNDIQNLYLDSLTPPQGDGTNYRPSDSLQQILHSVDPSGRVFNQPPYEVCDSSGNPVAPNFLSWLIGYAHSQGIEVDLSFGGAAGGGKDYKLPQDPVTSAKNLAAFVNNMGFDSVDFDFESHDPFTQNSPQDLSTFFSTLHSQLQTQGKQSTITLMGGALDDPAYNPVTQNLNLFDGVNLMLYSNTQYYLNAKGNTVWPGIEGWLSKMPGQDPSKLHIGFYDSIPYEQASANGDAAQFDIRPGSSRGQAAAEIYQQLCQQLQTDGYLKPGQTLGNPFFWNDTPGDSRSEKVMQDFFDTLKTASKKEWK